MVGLARVEKEGPATQGVAGRAESHGSTGELHQHRARAGHSLALAAGSRPPPRTYLLVLVRTYF